MATDFIMPRLPDPPQNAFFQAHHQQQPISFQSHNYHPQISPLSTSSNASPTSSLKPYHTRQVRPLYIPAVLRPTEHPSKAPPPPKHKAENDGSGGGSGAGANDDDKVLRSSGSFISLPGLGSIGIGRLTRRSTNDSGKCLDASWNLDLFPEVKGLPSRTHWKVCTLTHTRCLASAVSWVPPR